MKIEVTQCSMCKHYSEEQYCEIWQQYIANDAFYCACGAKADRKTEPQYDFGEYADRLWKIAYERGKREALEQTEPQSEYEEYLERIRPHDPHKDWFEDEPQTDCAWK